jgi:hypothetical protein
MITRLGMAPRLPHFDSVGVLRHWQTSHADAAGQIPMLRRYVQLHPVLVDGRFPLPYPGFDAGSELDFDDLDAMDAGFASETYQTTVRADEDSFVDKSRFSMLLADRRILRDGERGGVRLVTLLRVHPARERKELFDALTGPYAEAVHATTAGHHEQLHRVDVERPEPIACDATTSVVFPTVDEALAWAASDDALRVQLTLAGLAFGSERLLARPHVVLGEL